MSVEACVCTRSDIIVARIGFNASVQYLPVTDRVFLKVVYRIATSDCKLSRMHPLKQNIEALLPYQDFSNFY